MTARGRTFAAGAVLIVLANAVALSGVAYNRSGTPESRLALTQRELGRPANGYGKRENSGVSLDLKWRVLSPEPHHFHNHSGGSAEWLDEERLAALGFDIESARSDEGRKKSLRRSERQVFIVLELAGAAWLESLTRARQRLAHQESLEQASPKARELIAAAKNSRQGLAREEDENSRLFAVDLGSDLASLRLKYPDRSRYLIARGKLRLQRTSVEQKWVVFGYLSDLGVHQINVPHAWRPVLEALPPHAGTARKAPEFTAVVAVGKRLEPWIEAITTP